MLRASAFARKALGSPVRRPCIERDEIDPGRASQGPLVGALAIGKKAEAILANALPQLDRAGLDLLQREHDEEIE